MFSRRIVSIGLLFVVGATGCNRSAPVPKSAVVRQNAASFAAPNDDLNRPVALKAPAKRVVVIGPGALETVFALGVGDTIVGRDEISRYPLRAVKIEVAGDFQGPSVEKCIGLRPDLVILQGETWDKARVDAWQNQVRVPVAALTATSLNNLAADFEKIGVWLGRPKEAISLAKEIKNLRGQGHLSAFVEIERSPLWAAGQSTLIDDVLRASGFKNAAAQVRGYQPFGLESLLAQQPDVYIVTSTAPLAQILRELRASPALSKLKCIQKGQVIAVDGDLLLRGGPRLRQGIEKLRQASKNMVPLSASARK